MEIVFDLSNIKMEFVILVLIVVLFSLGLSWHTHTGSNIGVTLKVTLPRPPLSFGVALWGYV